MTTYPLWADIPYGVTVYVPNHALLEIKLENTTLVFLKECVVPKPAPRQWQSLQDVPKGVQVRDNEGDRWKRKKGVWHYKEADTWYSSDTLYEVDALRPFTEIVK
ncbi:hypothetical protein [Mycobacteroides abscessus]|uniref:hypothetical protein n=1 Tax=Mycobacteroides abscessus TaxID=36809 RepID=UPI001896A4A5